MDQRSPYQIAAIAVNHNTSRYMELMLRSLFTTHPAQLNLMLTVYDNGSNDDMSGLLAYAARHGIDVVPSGLPLDAPVGNSHGEILYRVVRDVPDCTHYLFLDADVCFLTSDTLLTLLEELEQAPHMFGIMPRLSADGVTEIPEEYHSIYAARLHPCCALVKNTAVFRRVASGVGFSCVNYLWAEREEYLDTFALMTRVMATHGLGYHRSTELVLHFFGVSWDKDQVVTEQKAAHCQRRLDALRAQNIGSIAP
jgi:hypothetical protein